jgi:hypothetical protein
LFKGSTRRRGDSSGRVDRLELVRLTRALSKLGLVGPTVSGSLEVQGTATVHKRKLAVGVAGRGSAAKGG